MRVSLPHSPIIKELPLNHAVVSCLARVIPPNVERQTILRILAPNVLVLNSESNERDPHTSMRTMGENLAKEVHR